MVPVQQTYVWETAELTNVRTSASAPCTNSVNGQNARGLSIIPGGYWGHRAVGAFNNWLLIPAIINYLGQMALAFAPGKDRAYAAVVNGKVCTLISYIRAAPGIESLAVTCEG